MELDQLSDTLCHFLMEIWKQNGDEYPRETLYEIVLSLQHYMAMNGRQLKLLDHPQLVKLWNILDNRMKLSKAGVVCNWLQAESISVDQENHMWNTGLLGEDAPEKLVNTKLYLIGVHFTLRTVNEHKNLHLGGLSQFKIKVDPQTDKQYLLYTEHSSKIHQGGLKDLHKKPKVVAAFENTENPECCIVHLFQKYCAKQPTHDPKCSTQFYLRPLAKVMNKHIWYSCQPIGVNTLRRVITKLCDAAGIPGKHTNHSLRSTAATRLYQNNVDEQQIIEITGHHSVAVWNYKCTSLAQQAEVSNLLYGKKTKSQPTATLSKAPRDEENTTSQGNFDMDVCTQVNMNIDEKLSDKPQVNIQTGQVHVKQPIINLEQQPIIVQPVINVKATDLQRKSDGTIILPLVTVNLMININWHVWKCFCALVELLKLFLLNFWNCYCGVSNAWSLPIGIFDWFMNLNIGLGTKFAKNKSQKDQRLLVKPFVKES